MSLFALEGRKKVLGSRKELFEVFSQTIHFAGKVEYN
jgi:hypothetical protein